MFTSASPAPSVGVASVTPVTAPDLADRAGYDPTFLGVDVPLPAPRDPAVATVLLPYTHFSVRLRPDRRLAAVAGAMIDGATLADEGREGIDWVLDPRVPAEQQTGDEVYARNDLDRGHLVRRASVVWGPRAEAQQANVDTFTFPNAAPQAAAFNQGEELWLGLENYLLDNAATLDRRLVVHTAPVLDAADPVYRGVGLPLRFVKVAAFLDAGGLGATAYLLDQTPLVDDLPRARAARDEPPARAVADLPPLGPFRTFGVPVADVAALTGLDLDGLAAVDRLPASAAWQQLESLAQLAWVRRD